MEYRNELKEAERRLQELIDERAELQAQISQAVEDGDANLIIFLRNKLSNNNVWTYATRNRITRLEKSIEEEERAQAIGQRERLEELLKDANRQYAEAVTVADNKRIAVQTLQVQLFALDQKIETSRQAIGQATKELRVAAARWKEDALKQAGEDIACT